MKTIEVFCGALLILALSACAPPEREEVSQADLLELREQTAEMVAAQSHDLIEQLVARAKSKVDAYDAGTGGEPPTIDLLVISGGGDYGAFGAGVLNGWGSVQGEMARPQFDVVTGVSTGALIAPFAFIGDEQSLDRIEHLYRNPKEDWVKPRGLLYFLPNNESFAEVPGLERELQEHVDRNVLQRIVDAGGGGRVLLVNTTNLDDENMRVWDVVVESRRALETGDMDRVRTILLASAGIPGAFPAREIDGSLYVDGAVTGNILYGGRAKEKDSFWVAWKQKYPDVPLPKVRYWVIFNNRFMKTPKIVERRWPSVVERSIDTAGRWATLTSMRHLHAMAEVARLKYDADVEVRIISIPLSWEPPKPGIFVKETMNDLANLGNRMGADPASWQSDPP